MLIDRYLDKFDFSERHLLMVAGQPDEIYRTAHEVDFSESLIIRSLLRLRGMPTENFSLKAIERSIFKKLDEEPGHELVLGLVGRFWTIYGDLQKIGSGADFCEFDKPGYAKAVWNFTVAQKGTRSCLTTETRIKCLDDASRRNFGRYWTLIRPFSGLIRIEMLRAIKRRVESRA
ncbi:MAG: hypothetical protein AB7Q37_00770 [Pyrinomonadaceae bacterium]